MIGYHSILLLGCFLLGFQNSKGCIVLFPNDNEQMITSHNDYPDKDYKDNVSNCWTLITEPGFGLTLRVDQFSLQESDNCTDDYLEISSQCRSRSDEIYSRYCGVNIPSKIMRTVYEVCNYTLLFITDTGIVDRGFSLYYSQQPVAKHVLPTPVAKGYHRYQRYRTRTRKAASGYGNSGRRATSNENAHGIILVIILVQLGAILVILWH